MKVGSLVVCVRGFEGDWEAKPVFKDKIYTVRELRKDSFGDDCITLEEVINKVINYSTGSVEPAYDPSRFRELDTPQSISIEEILEEPVYA